MKCPECGEELEVNKTYLNGNPITEIKCNNCNFMRIRNNHEVFSVNDL